MIWAILASIGTEIDAIRRVFQYLSADGDPAHRPIANGQVLQASPRAVGERDAQSLVRLWLWLAFDYGTGMWSVFAFTIKVTLWSPAPLWKIFVSVLVQYSVSLYPA